VEKQTNPDGAAGSFSFTGDAAGSIGDGGQITVSNLAPGTYTSTEGDPTPGFDLTSISCDDGASATPSTVNVGTRKAYFKLDPGETVKCTFTNRQRGKIVVIKDATPNDPQDFSFSAGGGLSPSSFSLDDDSDPTLSNTQMFNNVTPGGAYSVSETVPQGWDQTSATCDDGSPISNINVSAGETVTCTFNNRKRARLIVEKQTDPDGAAGSFTFTGTAAGTIGDGGNIPVGNLVPGTYTSTENNPNPNFDLTSIVCTDGNSTGDVTSRTATFRLEPGETVKCTFTNRQRGMAKVIKTFNGGALGANTFTFQLRSGASAGAAGTILESLTANAGLQHNWLIRKKRLSLSFC